MDFNAFISYSHAADGQLAPALQKAMQRLAKPWFRMHSLRVFRDESALSANPHLWSSIQAALDGSEWFILLASPEAVASEWVGRELDHWMETRSADRILVLVTDGTLEWDPTAQALTGNAVPAILSNAFQEEPRHVDLRWAHLDVDLDLRNTRFRDAVAEVCAPIHGVAKDELESEDVRLHRRMLRTARVGVAALVLLTALSLIAGAAAINNAHSADHNRANAEFNLVVSESHDLISYQRDLSLLLAVEARHMRNNLASDGALEAALAQEPRFAGYTFNRNTSSGFTSVCPVGEGNTVAAAGSNGRVGIFHLTTKTSTTPNVSLSQTLGKRGGGVICASSHDGSALVAGEIDSGKLWVLNPKNASPVLGPFDTGSRLDAVAVSPDGRTIAAGAVSGAAVSLWHPYDPDSSLPKTIADGQTLGAQYTGVAFSPDGKYLVSSDLDSGAGQIDIWDTSTWTLDDHFAVTTNDIPGCECDRRSDAGDGVIRPTVTPTALVVSPDSQSFLVSTSLFLRDYSLTGTLRWQVRTPYTNRNSAAFTPDGKIVVSQTSGDQLRLLDAATGDEIQPPISSEVGSASLAVTDQGRIVAAPSDRALLAAWDVVPHVIAHAVRSAPQSYVPLQYSADGRELLLQDADSSDPLIAKAAVWDETNGRLLPLPKVVYPLFTIGHSIGGIFVRKLSLATFNVDDQAFGARQIPFTSLNFEHVESHSFNSFDRYLFVGRPDGAIAEFSLNGRTIRDPWIRVKGFPYSLDAEAPGRVAVGLRQSGETIVLNIATGKPFFRPLKNVRYPTFSPDGSRLAGFIGPSRVQVYDGRTGNPIGHPLVAPPGSEELQFNSNGSVLAVRAQQGTSIYNVNSGQIIGDPFPTTDYAVLRPDGQELATPTAQGTLLWSLNPNRWQATACQLAGRNLTHAEWARYFPGEPYHATCSQWPTG